MKGPALLALFAAAASAQNLPCSLSAVGDDVQVFACSGLKAQSAQILEILNRIAADKLDPASVIAKLADLPRGSGARSITLTDTQKTNLLTLAKMYPGQKIAIVYPLNDAAAAKTAVELTSILSEGKWLNPDGSAVAHPSEVAAEKPFIGIEVLLNSHDLEDRQLPKAAIPLTLTLEAMGYARHPASADDIPPGTIRLKVGTPP
jgi:hypothetical protein